MRLAGEIPVSIKDLIAQADTSTWPSINNPVPAPTQTPVRYDDHMKMYVPIAPPVRGV